VYDLLGIITTAMPIVLPLAGAIYTFFASRSKANDDRLDALTKRLDKAELELTAAGHNANALASINTTLVDHDRRLMSVENELKHLPSAEHVNDLKLEISKLAGLVGRLEEQMASVSRTTHRIDDYLRETGGKA
jgi:predicted  nucleic acid-binding Zn-ribbon protein